jgi:hypothetical protein
MNSRFTDQYKKTGLLCGNTGKYKRAKRKSEDRPDNRFEHIRKQRNLMCLGDESETQKKAVDCKKLKLQKWKEEKQKQKFVKKASEKPAFKCGVVHHKVGPSYLDDIFNMNYKKMSSIPEKREGQKFTNESCTMNKDLRTYKSFAPPNFHFKPPVLRPAALIAEGPRSNISDASKGITSTESNENPIQENSLRRVTPSQTHAGNHPMQVIAGASKPVSHKKDENVDTSPLLQNNNLKNQRSIDEKELKVLKWNFTAPSEEFAELLKVKQHRRF